MVLLEEVLLLAADVLPVLVAGFEGVGGWGEEAVVGVLLDELDGLFGQGMGVRGQVLVGGRLELAIWRP